MSTKAHVLIENRDQLSPNTRYELFIWGNVAIEFYNDDCLPTINGEPTPVRYGAHANMILADDIPYDHLAEFMADLAIAQAEDADWDVVENELS